MYTAPNIVYNNSTDTTPVDRAIINGQRILQHLHNIDVGFLKNFLVDQVEHPKSMIVANTLGFVTRCVSVVTVGWGNLTSWTVGRHGLWITPMRWPGRARGLLTTCRRQRYHLQRTTGQPMSSLHFGIFQFLINLKVSSKRFKNTP